MTISMIVAAGEDNAIGKGHDMLWHLPDDFKYFKNTTQGHPVIMGRKTMESLGKCLPNRENIVITRSNEFKQEGAHIVHSMEEALKIAELVAEEEIFIIGGGQIYRSSLKLANKVYLTRVHSSFPEADVHFPRLPIDDWRSVSEYFHDMDDRHEYAFTFQVFERK